MYQTQKLDELHLDEVEKFVQHLNLTKLDQRRAAFEMEKCFVQKHQPHLKYFIESQCAQICFNANQN